MKVHNLAFVDVETTGTNYDKHEVIELALIVVKQVEREGKGPKIEILGGVNGAGMKLSNYYSEYFILETIDGLRKLHYKQKMENGARVIHDPVITDISKMSPMPESFTSITFKPDYKKLDYPSPNYADFVVYLILVLLLLFE